MRMSGVLNEVLYFRIFIAIGRMPSIRLLDLLKSRQSLSISGPTTAIDGELPSTGE